MNNKVKKTTVAKLLVAIAVVSFLAYNHFSGKSIIAVFILYLFAMEGSSWVWRGPKTERRNTRIIQKFEQEQ